MLEAAIDALLILLDLHRFALISAGVIIGLLLGILPGVGGTVGLAILLPFTFGMDPPAAFAFLLGMAAVTATGDTIPAVLFGVPGTSGAQATVLDGHPLGRRGEAGRALSAAYTASVLGGLFGALVLGLAIPLLQPVIIYMGAPELLALSCFGISMVSSLSGNAPLKGIAAACLGILIAMIGVEHQTGTLRWTFGMVYLWEGLPLVPAVLGIFALPELCDLAIKRVSIAGDLKHSYRVGMLAGSRDALRNWWLIIRCSVLGAAIGALPGLGSSVVDWLAYGHALRSEKGAQQSFGKGDIRGVIAPESANNAKEGGGLVPTIAFGVPGSSGMAILLGAFLIHGLVPGPEMLTTNLHVTYSMVWSIAIANILGAGLCYAFSGYFAKIALLRFSVIIPIVLGFIYLGAFQASREWGDIYVLVVFGFVGWLMKRFRWPRPPLVLGLVLGSTIEKYFSISINRYGAEWLTKPVVLVLLAMSLIALCRPLFTEGRKALRVSTFRFPNHVVLRQDHLFYLGLIGLFAGALVLSHDWPFEAQVAPAVVVTIGLVAAGTSLITSLLESAAATMPGGAEDDEYRSDLVTDFGTLSDREVFARAATFIGWVILLACLAAAIGSIPALILLVALYMRLENRERWTLIAAEATAIAGFVYLVFDKFLGIPWPRSLLGEAVPLLRWLPSV